MLQLADDNSGAGEVAPKQIAGKVRTNRNGSDQLAGEVPFAVAGCVAAMEGGQ